MSATFQSSIPKSPLKERHNRETKIKEKELTRKVATPEPELAPQLADVYEDDFEYEVFFSALLIISNPLAMNSTLVFTGDGAKIMAVLRQLLRINIISSKGKFFKRNNHQKNQHISASERLI